MDDILDDIETLGVSLVGIGNGTAAMTREFAESFHVRFPLYTDPSRKVYQHYGMKRTLGLGPASIKRAAATYRKGYRQGATKGDAFQQGGAVLFDTSGAVRWCHIDDGPGDHAELDEMIAAAQSVTSL